MESMQKQARYIENAQKNIGGDDELDLDHLANESNFKLAFKILMFRVQDFYVIDFNTSHTLYSYIFTPLIDTCTLKFYILAVHEDIQLYHRILLTSHCPGRSVGLAQKFAPGVVADLLHPFPPQRPTQFWYVTLAGEVAASVIQVINCTCRAWPRPMLQYLNSISR